ncbi:MAG TPA: alpha/beta hydrolase [Aggregatilineales bacterium]|nr:alpha/beta hydrolase [Aggregatilineales bacterium]
MSLYVAEYGSANVPTIVFLHGGGGAGWMWQPQIERFQDYHCLVPDLPEHGRSMEVKLGSAADAAVHIADLIRERTREGRAHVVGLSLGAQVLTALLASAPEVVDHAVINSALVRPLPGAWMYTPALLAWTFRLTVAPLKWSDGWTRINMNYAAGVPEKYFPQFRQDFRAATATSFGDVMAANQNFRLPQGLDRVTARVLVLVGNRELAAMKESARDLAAAIPHARGGLVVHEAKFSTAQEHNWNLNAPELFTATVRAWIEDKPLPSAVKPLG